MCIIKARDKEKLIKFANLNSNICYILGLIFGLAGIVLLINLIGGFRFLVRIIPSESIYTPYLYLAISLYIFSVTFSVRNGYISEVEQLQVNENAEIEEQKQCEKYIKLASYNVFVNVISFIPAGVITKLFPQK